MSRSSLFALCVAVLVCAPAAPAQEAVQPDSLGLPGDNLNLYAVLTIFQESPTLEEFEKRLNSDSLSVNNLDLNGDQKIDYIRVYNYVVDGGHNIVLQVDLSPTESQDVAVIEVKETSENKVYVQIIGDEELYGSDYIIEPNYDPAAETAKGSTANPGYAGSTTETGYTLGGKPVIIVTTTPYHVARWRIVRYMYAPGYRPWHSPWHHSYYPPWWRPWRPHYWHAYWGYHYNHHHYYWAHYRRWDHYRNPPAYRHYHRHMRAQATVVIERKKKDAFRDMYARPDLKKEGFRRYEKQNPGGPWKPQAGTVVQKPDAGRPPSMRPGRPVTIQPTPDRLGEGESGTPPPKETRPTQPIGTRPSGGERTSPAPTPATPGKQESARPGGPVTTQPPRGPQGEGSSEATPPKDTKPTLPTQPSGKRPSTGERTEKPASTAPADPKRDQVKLPTTRETSRTAPSDMPPTTPARKPEMTPPKETKPSQPTQPSGTRPSTGERTTKPTSTAPADQKRDEVRPTTTKETSRTSPSDAPTAPRKR